MNSKEKIDRATNTARLCLYKEGIFYKLYNQHAMLFVQNIKPLKVTAKFVKVVNQHVYSVGFPGSLFDTIKELLTACGGKIEEAGDVVTVCHVTWKTENDYILWCEQQQKEQQTAGIKSVGKLTDIEKQIVGFQIMRKTPMEAMDFIIELQQELNKANEC
jgi:hypothetical protein